MKNSIVIHKSGFAQIDLLPTEVTCWKDDGEKGVDENRVNNYEH
ncbi:MAG: hypothetical protein ACFE7I_09745 [Candidatus Hodarchaeota archaeon]